MSVVHRVLIAVMILVQAYASLASAQSRLPLIHSIDVQISVAPVPIPIAGRTYLVYELHITNLASSDIQVLDIEALDSRDGVSILELNTARLRASWRGLGSEDEEKAALLRPGARGVVFIWLELAETRRVPTRLSHRLTFDVQRESGRERATVVGGAIELREQELLVLDPPLRGGPWVALYDPSMQGGHRTSIYAIEGRARIPARFAIDWVRLGRDATYSKDDGSRVADWHGYGADVLAVADGVIVHALDDMPALERTDESQGPMPLQNASGNHVVLDVGQGRFAFYEHLKHGSIRVRAGDKVKSGQVIAALGNSGSSSSGPHLHFHVADAPATLAAEGLPYVFRSFEVIGAYDQIDDFTRRIPWKRVPERVGTRTAELPGPNTVLIFAE